MGKIPVNLETVGISEAASIDIDVDNIVRKAMIFLFDVRDESGEQMDSYDEAYFELASYGFNISSEGGGASDLIRTYTIYHTKTMSALFQMFLYMVQPIKLALKLPDYLSNPKKLVKKIKEIVKSVKKLIDDIIEVLTDTKNWFIKQFLDIISKINIPIPSIDLLLLAFNIKLPEFGKLGHAFLDATLARIMHIKDKISKIKDKISAIADQASSAFAALTAELNNLTEELTSLISGEFAKILAKIADLREKLKWLTGLDINGMIAMALGLIGMCINLLKNVLFQEIIDLYEIVYRLHKKMLLKVGIINKHIGNYNQAHTLSPIPYCTINYEKDLLAINAELGNHTEKNGLKYFNGEEERLYEFVDRITEVVDDEEQAIYEYLSKHTIISKTQIESEFKVIDEDIKVILVELKEQTDEIKSTLDEINNYNESSDLLSKFKDFLLDIFKDIGGAMAEAAKALAIAAIQEEIADLMARLKFINPVEAWLQNMMDFMMNVIKAPIDIIMALIQMIMDGIMEFIGELPIPSFAKIKKFFEDLMGLGDLEKMTAFLMGIIQKIYSLIPDPCPTLENVMSFLPWLFVTVTTEFIKSVASPLPIPI